MNNQLNSSLGNTFKLVPIQFVMNSIYRVFDNNAPDIMSETDMLESASTAAHHIYNYKYYEEAICISALNEYKVLLPDYRKIKAVFWKDDLSDKEYSELIVTLKKDLTKEESEQVTATLPYDFSRSSHARKWNLAYPKHSVATLTNMNVVDELSMGSSCTLTYSVKDCVMTLSQPTGYVLVLYDRLLRDDEGNMLIPFIPEVEKAIRWHVLMETQLRQLNSHRQGSVSLFQQYEDRWETTKNIAKAKLMELDLPEWISMNIETNKMVQGTDPIERHVQANNGPEDINLGTYIGTNSLIY